VLWLAGGDVVVLYSLHGVDGGGLACRSLSGHLVHVLTGGPTPTSLGERGEGSPLPVSAA
jgi:hypothetical protein